MSTEFSAGIYELEQWQCYRLPVHQLLSSVMQCFINIHCVAKKFPPLNSLYLCQILTDFQNFCTAGMRMKFATKLIRHYPPHLRHVATLPWEMKNSNFLQMWKKVQTNCIFDSL